MQDRLRKYYFDITTETFRERLLQKKKKKKEKKKEKEKGRKYLQMNKGEKRNTQISSSSTEPKKEMRF